MVETDTIDAALASAPQSVPAGTRALEQIVACKWTPGNNEEAAKQARRMWDIAQSALAAERCGHDDHTLTPRGTRDDGIEAAKPLMAKFEKQRFGATVAQIHETAYEAIEVQARNDGKFILTVHNRRGGTDLWDDMSVTLEPKHFEMLGSIASQQPISDIFGPNVGPPTDKPVKGVDTDDMEF